MLQRAAVEDGVSSVAPSRRADTVGLFALALLAAAALAWSGRTPNSDLFMALSAGRDIAAGQLAQPDSWSYCTSDRVWINQSWLSGWMLYHLYVLGGDAGLLLCRTGLIAGLALGLVVLSRSRGRSWPAALLAAACVIAACRYHLQLRGNLLTLVFVPWLAWLLDRQRRGSPHWAWAILLMLGVWAQAHGGFVFGWVMVGAWLALLGVAGLRARSRALLSRAGWLLAGLGLAAASAVTLSPFGVQSVRQSLAMSGQTHWRTVREWWPLIPSWELFRSELMSTSFIELGYFLILVCVTAMLGAAAIVRLVLSRRSGDAGRALTESSHAGAASSPGESAGRAIQLAFDLLMVALTIVMAVNGRRFSSIAALMLSLPLGASIDVLWGARGAGAGAARSSRAMRTIGAAALLGFSTALYPAIWLGFSNDHPFYPAQSIFQRQIELSDQPVLPAAFMRDNRIAGPILHPYNVEGFLRWSVPGVKVGCGSRAQQVYTEQDLITLTALLRTGRPTADDLRRREAVLDHYGVRLVLLPAATHWELIVAMITSEVRWIPIYFDGEFALLLNPYPEYEWIQFAVGESRTAVRSPDVASLDLTLPSISATDWARGEVARDPAEPLWYPSELIRQRSRALFMATPRLMGDPSMAAERREAFAAYLHESRCDAIRQAQQIEPTPFLYDLLAAVTLSRPDPPDLRPYLDAETARVAALRGTRYEQCQRLRAQGFLMIMNARWCRRAGDESRAAELERDATAMVAQLPRLARWWQF